MDITTNCHGHREVICRQLVCSHLHVVGFFCTSRIDTWFPQFRGCPVLEKHIPIQLSSATTNWWNSRKIPMMIFELPRAIIQHHPLHHPLPFFNILFWLGSTPKKPDRVGVIVRRWSWDLIFFPWGTQWYEKNIHDMIGYTWIYRKKTVSLQWINPVILVISCSWTFMNHEISR